MAATRRGSFLLAIALAFVAAVGGAFIGRAFISPPRAAQPEWHRLLHEQLGLDAAQSAKIAKIEGDFAARKQALEARQRAANADLAAAIAAEHGYGPRVRAAVDATHLVMGELQKATLEHVFAMRGVLRPDQAARFDAGIAKALTAQDR
jgi:Spy/CpxP family protein refolding chaperone